MMSTKTVQTLDDIAHLANVSPSTVSRALNNSPLLSQETRERIQALAKAHDFRINATARNLRMRQSHTIAFVTPAKHPERCAVEDLFGLEILGAIGMGLHDIGYDLLVVHVEQRDLAWAPHYLNSGRADGYILINSETRPSMMKNLVGMDIPLIVWGVPLPPLRYCSVSGDNITGGMLATQHLIGLGRQKIAFLGGLQDTVTVQHRYQGYLNALQWAGRSPDPAQVAYGDYSYESGLHTMRRLLKATPDLDAVFVNSDLMAIAAIQALQEAGKSVPEQVAVVGYDDLSIAAYNNLPLTPIRQNIPLAGKLLAQNLVQFIQTGVVTNVTTPVELVIRKSA